ncbi:MAG TPA: tRNA (adenosine(37)-N6)-threonylcarbamoyltransferase complex dimerization subunit type 1 TsaB [Pyrinomonadaceae bacterium]|nr:tRNA (adenosine(37)-N6)-threonylcarbamoyltransferase complex dimerization subunit type 1 TsaB [Pyrinomonadaceae bacterium]
MNPLILSIETATLGGGVCLFQADTVLAVVAGDPKLSHSNILLRDVDDCLKQARVTIQDVELFAAASGPGSFTGLRIGLATVKALAATLQRPCVGIPTLQAIARTAGNSGATVSLLPAGRGEVFVQEFSVGEDVIEVDAAAHLPPGRAIARYGERQALNWVGPGALIHQDLIASAAQAQGISFQLAKPGHNETPEQGWALIDGETCLAQHIAALAKRRFERRELEGAESLRAIYVRPSDAELKCN